MRHPHPTHPHPADPRSAHAHSASAHPAPAPAGDGASRAERVLSARSGAVDLIAAAHGTADPRGIREVHALVRLMAAQRPELPVSLGFVDVDVPALPALVDRVVADGNEAVVVPLLLSSGYHTAVDIAGEATRRPTWIQAAPALGPAPALADVLVDRLAAAVDLRSTDRVVLAAAGSSDTQALLDCSATATMLANRINRPVEVGYVSGAGERLGSVLARTTGSASAPYDSARSAGVLSAASSRGARRRSGRRVAVATYLLAPGFFADRVRQIAGELPVSEPLGADPRVAALALARYDAARELSAVVV